MISALNSCWLSKNNTGLGNVLFQISSIYGIAKRLGLEPIFPVIEVYCNKLKALYGFNHGQTILRNIPLGDPSTKFLLMKEECHAKVFNPDLIQRIHDSSENIIVEGYLEHLRYFDDCIPEIQELFRCDDATSELLRTRYKHLFDSETYTPVSVHIRGGAEFLTYHHGINVPFYKRAIDHICTVVSNPIFLIFTDVKESVPIELFEGLPHSFMTNEYDYMDLYCMTFCKHNILSASTFSFWGAFLNESSDKLVLYDKDLGYEYLSIFTPV